MTFCNAFDNNLNPCLNEIEHGEDVCATHSTFYSPEEWFERYIFSVNRELYYFSSGSKIQAIYKKAILEGRIKITHEHFRDLESNERPYSLVDYYLLCGLQPGVDLLWSNKLFTTTVRTILAMHSPGVYPMVLANKQILNRFLDPLFSTTRSFESMVSHVLFSIMSLNTLNIEESSLANLNGAVSLLQYIKTHPKFNTEILLGHAISINNLLLLNTKPDDKIGEFLKTIPDQRKSCREMLHEKNTAMREEISYAVWRPECFLGFEEYKELKARWGLIN